MSNRNFRFNVQRFWRHVFKNCYTCAFLLTLTYFMEVLSFTITVNQCCQRWEEDWWQWKRRRYATVKVVQRAFIGAYFFFYWARDICPLEEEGNIRKKIPRMFGMLLTSVVHPNGWKALSEFEKLKRYRLTKGWIWEDHASHSSNYTALLYYLWGFLEMAGLSWNWVMLTVKCQARW